MTVLREYGQIEVVVIVGDEHFAIRVDANADRIVGDAFATNASQEVALVVEHFYRVGSIVAYEYLFAIVRAATTIGKLQILGTVELVQYVAHEIEDDHAHHFALDHDDALLGVDADAARMLQDVGAKLANKVAELVVDLNLMRWRAFGDHNLARISHNGHSIRIEQLTFSFATLAKLELETALFVKYLYAMRVSVRNYDVIVAIDSHAARLGEQALGDAELAKLA